METLFLLFVAIILVLGIITSSIISLLVRKFPNLSPIFFVEDLDRNGDPIDEDF